MSEGRELPQAMRNAPSLHMGLELYYNAFLKLMSCRNGGNIPWTAILEYCREYDITGDQREAMFHHMQVMDECYLNHFEKVHASGNS